MGLGSRRHTYKNASRPTDFRFPPPSTVSTNDSHEEAGREEEEEEKQKGPTSGHVRSQANCQPSTPTPRSFLERKVGRSGCPLRWNGFETDRGWQRVLQAGGETLICFSKQKCLVKTHQLHSAEPGWEVMEPNSTRSCSMVRMHRSDLGTTEAWGQPHISAGTWVVAFWAEEGQKMGSGGDQDTRGPACRRLEPTLSSQGQHQPGQGLWEHHPSLGLSSKKAKALQDGASPCPSLPPLTCRICFARGGQR